MIFDFLCIAQPYPRNVKLKRERTEGETEENKSFKVKGKINEERRTKQKQGEEV